MGNERDFGVNFYFSFSPDVLWLFLVGVLIGACAPFLGPDGRTVWGTPHALWLIHRARYGK
jgi:hypothetical protein